MLIMGLVGRRNTEIGSIRYGFSKSSRAPSYVSREVGAFELCITPETWDELVAQGYLPRPVPGMPRDLPRWRMEEVSNYLGSGDIRPRVSLSDGGVAGAANIRGPHKRKKRPVND